MDLYGLLYKAVSLSSSLLAEQATNMRQVRESDYISYLLLSGL
jgi:hypothetical protein